MSKAFERFKKVCSKGCMSKCDALYIVEFKTMSDAESAWEHLGFSVPEFFRMTYDGSHKIEAFTK